MNNLTKTGLWLLGIQFIIPIVILIGFLLTSITWNISILIIALVCLYNFIAIIFLVVGLINQSNEVRY